MLPTCSVGASLFWWRYNRGVLGMAVITEDRIQRIEARVTAVEQAQNDNTQSLRFIVTTVAQMKAVQDDHGVTLNSHSKVLDEHSKVLNEHSKVLNEHSKVLNEHSKVLNEHSKRFDRVDADIAALRSEVGGLRGEVQALRKELPGIVADVMREVLREPR
jgi:chromosome segregation ATPase